MIGRDGIRPALAPATQGSLWSERVREEYGRILRANQQLADLLGRTVEAIVGTRLCAHVHPDDQTHMHHGYLRLMAHPQALYEGSVRLVAADNDPVRVHAFASAVTMNTGVAFLCRVLPL